MRVMLIGSDGVGWSIDRDRAAAQRAIEASGHSIVRTPIAAEAVYCVWWNLLANGRYRLLRRKPLVAVVTNDLAHQGDLLARVQPSVDVWVAANSGQRDFLAGVGVDPAAVVVSPFYVEEDIFKPAAGGRQELAAAAGVDFERVRDRFLVGSFQRDSLGADVTQSKWQKDPDLLLDVVEGLGDDAMLVLAGPRRHYVLEQCRRRAIPYLYVGSEPEPGSTRDDISENTLSLERIAALWNLVDVGVVSSRSEGGPKALIEAPLTGTPVISTRVGMAPDLLPEALLFADAGEGATLLRRLRAAELDAEVRKLVDHVREVNRFEAFRQRVDAALAAVAGSRGSRP
jgi:glycosyltransferase involved in cell wall biosynthesis